MHAKIPTYPLYGLDALPADVTVGPGGVRVVERVSGWTLLDVKQELGSCMQSGVQGCPPNLGPPNLGRRELAPADLKDAGGFELPLALGLLLGSGQVAFEQPTRYPNPDVAIEIDLSSPEVDRPVISAALKVGEAWRFDGESMRIELLGPDGTCLPATKSRFPPIRADEVVR
jgi:hypothetical protein